MKYLENVNADFFFFQAKSKKLAEIFGDKYIFDVADDVVSIPWLTKGDAFIGEDEQHISFCSQLSSMHEQSDFCHRIVWFGRDVCTARSPKCGECPLKNICKRGKVNEI